MSKIENGGPAFPCVKSWQASKHGYEASGGEEGMTLRDYFAARALAVACEDHPPAEAAALAYEYADAMLEARK